MKVTKDALLRVIRATRRASRMAEMLQSEACPGGLNVMDDISGDLQDSLMMMAGEEGNYENTVVFRVLNSDTEPEDCAAVLLNTFPAPQPKPVFFSEDAIRRMNEQPGAYIDGRMVF